MDLKTRYEAAMVLSGVGDALGYKNGEWEFCHSGEIIHREAENLGGVAQIEVKLPGWPISDDTVMHLALAEALTTPEDSSSKDGTPGEAREALYARIAEKFKRSMDDMTGRAPGPTTMSACSMLKPNVKNGYRIRFDPRGGGCGAAMRAMCIGLRYPRPEELGDLIAVSVESGRMTHHHPTGYLGSLAAALFTSYAIQGKDEKDWGYCLVNEVLPKALEYIKECAVYPKENEENWDYFKNKWVDYLISRGLSDGKSGPIFPEKYGIKERDAFYKSVSFDGWGGASGHDAPMIAYDALLNSQRDWIKLCSYGMFHSGDSDSTGVMAACWYGAIKGFEGVPECNYKKLEYRDRLEKRASKLFALSHPEAAKTGDVEEIRKKPERLAQELPSEPSNPDLDEPTGGDSERLAQELPNVPSNPDLGEPEGGESKDQPLEKIDDNAILERMK